MPTRNGRTAKYYLRVDFQTEKALLQPCLLPPPSEVLRAGLFLNMAATLHLAGDIAGAEQAIRNADIQDCAVWADRLWGKGGPWSRPRREDQPPSQPGIGPRHESKQLENAIVDRDGHWCRFCGIGVVRREVRRLLHLTYPDALRWGPANRDKHSGFLALTACFDHLLPYSRGGETSLDNMVLCCWPCNNGRASLTLAEVDLLDPRDRSPQPALGWDRWDGLSRLL